MIARAGTGVRFPGPAQMDKTRNPAVNVRREKRANEPYESRVDPAARLFRKIQGAEAELAVVCLVISKNRSALAFDVLVNKATEQQRNGTPR